MQYVFGPIPSRRLGRSLGVDPCPLKACNWNCVYCQLGRTSDLGTERRELVPADDVIAQVCNAVARHGDQVDWVSFVGSGEPTLHSGLGRMIRGVKRCSSLPVAVITNGSLLFQPDVRMELSLADAVLPTVSAGSEAVYLRLHRPNPALSFERFVSGLLEFRNGYAGKLWAEVMLVAGVNDSPSDLDDLADLLTRLRPDAVHLVLPTRPPCEDWVKPPASAAAERAAARFATIAEVLMPEPPKTAQAAAEEVQHESFPDAVISLITRHPMTEGELRDALGHFAVEELGSTLAGLERDGLAQRTRRHDRVFWTAAGSRFVERDRCSKQ